VLCIVRNLSVEAITTFRMERGSSLLRGIDKAVLHGEGHSVGCQNGFWTGIELQSKYAGARSESSTQRTFSHDFSTRIWSRRV
jgi:hypothetical protein